MTKKAVMMMKVDSHHQESIAALANLRALTAHNAPFVAVLDDMKRRLERQYEEALLVVAMLDDDGRVVMPGPDD